MMDQNMAQSLPPKPPINKPVRPKDKSVMAIILAVLLHVLVAVIVYFTVFHDKKTSTSEPLSLNNESSPPAAIITEDQQLSPSNITVSEPKVNPSSANNTKSDSSKTVNKNPAVNQDKAVTVQSKTVKDNDDDITEAIATAPSNNDKAAATDLARTDQLAASEYKLKQTRETQQLDADIDKESEQLSKLINEVKNRNQQQINQHSSNIPSAQPKSATDPNHSTIKQDYPIMPIPPLIDQQDKN